MSSTVYLIHFDSPLGDPSNPRGQAQHYIGTAKDVEERCAQHKAGRGAKIMAAVEEQGIGWRGVRTCVRTWKGGFKLERRLKDQHNAPRLCPICAAAHGKGEACQESQ